MTQRIEAGSDRRILREAAERFRNARKPVALSGAGISVECGIPDFRSDDGLWRTFPPERYATLQGFLEDPERVWTFYRTLGRTLQGKEPGAAHLALTRLEARGRLSGVITQNIDGLHSAAGSRQVVEVHGDCRSLHCPRCGFRRPAGDELLEPGPAPRCPECGRAIKPNVVLFGEAVQGVDQALNLLDGCDCLLVIGTSAEVYPVADYPLGVAAAGGLLIEFNLRRTPLTPRCDYLFEGPVGSTLPAFADAALGAGDAAGASVGLL